MDGAHDMTPSTAVTHAQPSGSLAAQSRSVPDMFLKRVARSGQALAWTSPGQAGWVETSWREVHDRAAAIASYLICENLEARSKVTIVGSTRPEWCLTDLGAQLAGLVTIGAYTTLTAEQLAYVVEHSRSEVVVVENEEQLKKLDACRDRLPHVRRILVWDMADRPADARIVRFSDVLATPVEEPRIKARVADIRPEDTAIVIYTSGTTGLPKGAMLSHDNILASLDALVSAWTLEPDDLMFSFLPLAHAAERICGLYNRINTGAGTGFAASVGSVLEDVKSVRPTYFGSVPRIFEKAHAKIEAGVSAAPEGKQRLFRWAERVGVESVRRELAGERLPSALRAQRYIADRLIFSKLRSVFGGRVKLFATGAAPTPMRTLEFFWGAGFPIYEVYGMTEATCVTHANRPGVVRLGSVGKTVPHVESKLAGDGEILVRGRVVFQGYLDDPAATGEAIDADGWLHTGDIGKLDADGYLYVVDRKKHIVITSGGKNITPANIENQIKAEDPILGQVHVHGDRRNYITALVTLQSAEALEWAMRRDDVAVSAADAEPLVRQLALDPLASPPELPALMREICASSALRARVIDAVRRANQKLSRVERVKRVLLLPRELSMAEDELTPTMKIKRKNVEKKFAEAFDRLYADEQSGLVIEDGPHSD